LYVIREIGKTYYLYLKGGKKSGEKGLRHLLNSAEMEDLK
jgi:hypothetical protein